MKKEDVQRIRKTVFDLVDFKYEKEIEVTDCEGVCVCLKDGVGKIGCDSISTLARGFFLFAKAVSEGKTEFEIRQKAHIKDCGCMLDASRNGVMTVESVKRFINNMAALGLNYLMLYTEDTYEIEGVPYFGYMRGRYSIKELQEIDEYAASMGVELVPCIQTLGHMTQYLVNRMRTPDSQGIYDITDTNDILLCGEEKTYEFIEKAIKSLRKAFRTNRIHIGMDEAEAIGLGDYLRKNGYHKSADILAKHLSRVVDICKKYDFKPMMWSDMFFKVISQNYDYYNNPELGMPQEFLDKIPDVELVYWDYYHEDEETYDKMLATHKKMGKEVVFGGGIGIWYGFLMTHRESYINSVSAMKMCLKHGIQTVFATMWGDDGCETNAFLALPLLPVFSEYCYRGAECTESDIAEASEFLTKINFEDAEKLGHNVANNNERTVKALFYSDILYNIGALQPSDCGAAAKEFADLRADMERCMAKNDKNYAWYNYAELLYAIAEIKANTRAVLYGSYKNGDRELLRKVADEYIPQLVGLYEEFTEVHRAQWFSTYKPFGYEVLSYRFGGVIARANDVRRVILDYLSGKIEKIEQLEEEQLPIFGVYGNASSYMTASTIR